MSTRLRRGQTAKQKERAAALALLKDALHNDKKRSEQVEMEDEDDMVSTVTEAEYAKIVEQRRNEGQFVVDDDDNLYYDDGEEHLFDSGASSSSSSLVNGPKKGHGALSSEAVERARRLEAQKRGPKKRVSSMFLASRGSVVGPKSVVSQGEGAVAVDETLDSALQSLNASIDASSENPFSIKTENAEEVKRHKIKKKAKSKQALLARMLLDPTAMADAEQHLNKQHEEEALEKSGAGGGSGMGFATFDDVEDASAAFDDGSLGAPIDFGDDAGADITASDDVPDVKSEQSSVVADETAGATAAASESSRPNAKAQLFKRRRLAAKIKREQDAAREQQQAEAQAKRKAKVAELIAQKRAAAEARKAGAVARRANAEARRGVSATLSSARPSSFKLNSGNGWEQVSKATASGAGAVTTASAAAGLGKLPVHEAQVKLPSGEKVTRQVLDFFWLDVFESTNNPGRLYVFGKIRAADGSFQSCCVSVPNVERRLLVLPRKTQRDNPSAAVSMEDVWKEVKSLFDARFPKESTFKSRCVKKKYAFELPDVPTDETSYLEVLYSARLPRFESSTQGNTFSRMFGTNTTCLEHFIIQRDIMGMLRVKTFVDYVIVQV